MRMKPMLMSIISLCLVLVIGIPAVIWNGFVLEHLWNWFVYPWSPVRVTLPLAVGVSCLLAMIRARPYRRNEDGWQPLVYCFTLPAAALFTGWIAHHYV